MKKAILIVSVSLALFFVTIVSIGVSAHRPYKQAREEAIALAQKKAGLETVSQFYWYNGEETYFSLTGKKENGENIVVLIQQNSGQMSAFSAKEMMTEAQAKARVKEDKDPQHILEARIGMIKNEPIWEVSFKQRNGKIGYYILSMQTGEWIRSIENI